MTWQLLQEMAKKRQVKKKKEAKSKALLLVPALGSPTAEGPQAWRMQFGARGKHPLHAVCIQWSEWGCPALAQSLVIFSGVSMAPFPWICIGALLYPGHAQDEDAVQGTSPSHLSRSRRWAALGPILLAGGTSLP